MDRRPEEGRAPAEREDELELIRSLNRGDWTASQLLELYHRFADRRRVQLFLAMHPRFPAGTANNLIPLLFPAEILLLVKNPRANPAVRRRAEEELASRFRKLPLGEKIALLKTAPPSLLLHFIDEDHPRLLETILTGPQVTEEIVLRFLNREGDRQRVYEVLDATRWHLSPAVAMAVAHDPEAPIKMLLKIIPSAGIEVLQRMMADPTTHAVVRRAVGDFIQNRPVATPTSEEEEVPVLDLCGPDSP